MPKFEVTVDVPVYYTFHLYVDAADDGKALGLVHEELETRGGEFLTEMYAVDRPQWLDASESWCNDACWEQVQFTMLGENGIDIADVSEVDAS